jgi:glycosyltransferase involved in cell wall biosynthesis
MSKSGRALRKVVKEQASVVAAERSILWVSNAPWCGTGYGGQCAQVVGRIAGDGHKVAVNVNYGFEAGNTSVGLRGNEITIYASGFGQWRTDAIKANAMHWSTVNQSDPLIVTLCDVWTLKRDDVGDIPTLSWTPVDHAPVPAKVAAWFQNDNVTAVAMSKFGKAMFDGAGIESVYIPHAFEPDIFKPTPLIDLGNGNVKSGRELLGISNDRFVVMMNSANKGVTPNRKAFGENLLAFAMFAADKPDALLYLHTEQFGAMGGIDLLKLAKACNINDEQIKFVDQYAYRSQIAAPVLAGIYSAADVLLSVSRGEGFGIPVIEAQACGVPVIVSDWTAQPELVGDGWVVKTQPEWDAMQDAWFGTPLVADIVDALNQAYERGQGTSQRAIDFVQQYNADTVFNDCWRPLLKASL